MSYVSLCVRGLVYTTQVWLRRNEAITVAQTFIASTEALMHAASQVRVDVYDSIMTLDAADGQGLWTVEDAALIPAPQRNQRRFNVGAGQDGGHSTPEARGRPPIRGSAGEPFASRFLQGRENLQR